jgi:hypothetical protein
MTTRSTTNLPPTIPLDPGLTGAQGMIGDDGCATVATVLADRGWRAGEVRPVQALYRPDRSLIVRYRTIADAPDGTRHSLWVCAETRHRPNDPEQVPDRSPIHGLPNPIERYGDRLIWAFPCDPGLPDNTLVTGDGRATISHLDGVVHHRTEPIRYRPRRRAVFKTRALRRTATGQEWSEVYVKVMTPAKASRAVETAAAVRSHASRLDLVLPRHRPSDGTLVFDAHPGASLRDLLLGEGASLPQPQRVATLVAELARIPVEPGSLPEMGDAVESAHRARRLLSRILPHLDDEIGRICAAVERGAQTADRSRHGVVHGDLYEGQLLVRDDFGLTVIDTDGLAWGDPADDAGTFQAHLLALADSHPGAKDRLLAYRRLDGDAFRATLDSDDHDLA